MLTLPTLAALLERYEAMAEAARANDWERLSALEREAAVGVVLVPPRALSMLLSSSSCSLRGARPRWRRVTVLSVAMFDNHLGRPAYLTLL